jgi:molybdate transport system substrate-binding protein
VRAFLSAVLFGTTALIGSAQAQTRDLVVYGEPTLAGALKSVGTLWRARSGIRVNVFVAPTDLSLKQIERGARCDVIFALPGADTEQAVQAKIIQAATVRRALRNGLALIGTRAAAAPAAPTLADVSRLIADQRLAIANPDRDPAGARAVALLRRLGITVDNGDKAVAVAESSAGVVSLLATGKAPLGIVYASDATAAGFPLNVALPAAEPPIDYVVAQARNPAQDTRPFMTFLTSPEAKAAFKTAGLVPIED